MAIWRILSPTTTKKIKKLTPSVTHWTPVLSKTLADKLATKTLEQIANNTVGHVAKQKGVKWETRTEVLTAFFKHCGVAEDLLKGTSGTE